MLVFHFHTGRFAPPLENPTMNPWNLKQTLICSAVLGALALSVAASAQDAYDYAPIDLPGTDRSQVFGVNERGDAIGNAFADNPDGTVDRFPFVYDIRKDRFTLIDEVAGFDATSILANNNRGDIVGSVFDNSISRESGVVIDRKGNAEAFDHPDAVSLTQPRAINNRGLITGFRDNDQPLVTQVGWVYDPKRGTFSDIVPSAATIAQGINGRGDIVGSATFFTQHDPCNPGAPPGSTVGYGWLRTADGDVRFFTINGERTRARGITDSGFVVGWTQNQVTGDVRGFVTDAEIGFCEDLSVGPDGILAYPDAQATFPQAITNWGAVVGSYNDVTGEVQSFVAVPK